MASLDTCSAGTRRCRHLVVALALLLAACAGGRGVVEPTADVAIEEGDNTMSLLLTSTAFDMGDPIPIDYTCDGDNVSPPLGWANVPAHTRSLALVCDDPDAPRGTWVHWMIFNIPPEVTELYEALPDLRLLPFGAEQGTNDFKNLGYGGPCPPPGGPHRYFFKLYALDTALKLEPGTRKQELLDTMAGHILAEAQLMGTYQRH